MAAGTAEGKVHIFIRGKEWHNFGFFAHKEAVNGLSWAPFEAPSDKSAEIVKRLVTGSSDKQIKVWEFKDEAEPTSQIVGKH